MNYQIRECTLEDAEAIFLLNRDEMGYEYPLNETRKKLEYLLKSGKDKLFVAIVQGQVVGYVHGKDYDVLYVPHMKNIMGIAVFKQYRRHGIGQALLQQLEYWAKRTGATGIRLVSGGERADAHQFYEKCGYTRTKQQINFKKYF